MRMILPSWLAVLLCAAVGLAQQGVNKASSASASGLKPQASQTQAIKPPSPTPTPEIERLVKSLSGTWSIVLKIEPSESRPSGEKGEGVEVWKPGPGGLSLIEDYHSAGDEGEIYGLGVAWWDRDAQKYQVMWCDNTNPAGCVMMKEGARWEGNQLVAVHESENTGKRTILKEVFSEITENSFKQTLYEGDSGSELKPILTILATKKTQPIKPSDAVTTTSVTSQTPKLKMPGPEVQNNMLGTWSITVKYEPSTEKPHGGTGKGTEVWRSGPGGTSVIEEYYQNDTNEHTEEFSPAWWDPQAGGQRFVFCANTVADGCLLSKNVAKWEGESLVYSEEREEAGRKIIASEVFTEMLPNSFAQILRKGDSEKSMKPTMIIRAIRVVPPSAPNP